jgi:hypothetical protein
MTNVKIDIKKFCTISNINILEDRQQDIINGVTDILNYTEILSGVNIAAGSSLNQLEKINEFQDVSISIDNKIQDEKKTIILSNAPSLIEKYFHVPNLINRK